ncbi:hypothetical protein NOI24_16280 [Neorhizobium galegae]|uniref:hypothetical protein n=1 Tax=Neorhizobium galegae TaxID=399 RepID=UPI0021054C71|nr:hypothetical protein [Neorhizobium galegae]MCQ1772868.1 hypothetical protein [Neorhizobium galegae]MCQ1799185.1 hypothetical protein [Neorhizobium galegae]
MYLVSILDHGAERVIRAETVTLTQTDVVTASNGAVQIFKVTQLLELLIIDPPEDAPEAVVEAARALIRKYRKAQSLN